VSPLVPLALLESNQPSRTASASTAHLAKSATERPALSADLVSPPKETRAAAISAPAAKLATELGLVPPAHQAKSPALMEGTAMTACQDRSVTALVAARPAQRAQSPRQIRVAATLVMPAK
jgi:hypothetical protein